MKLEIEVYEIKNGLVYFTSKYGKAHGVRKDNILPNFGIYNVEIDSEYKIMFQGICVVSQNGFCLKSLEEEILITAYVCHYENGCLTLMIEDDIVELIRNR